MPLHMLRSVTIGVPDVHLVWSYYQEFGLTPLEGGWLGSADAGPQLRLAWAPSRRLLEIEFGADDSDDVAQISHRLGKLELRVSLDSTSVTSTEPVTGVVVTARVLPRLVQPAVTRAVYNGPGDPVRGATRARGVLRTSRVKPRKLGHVVIGSVDQQRSERFFTEGFGLKVSDQVRGAASFLRCSTDHHNVLVQRAPVNFLHHTSWQVDDIDEIGRGATAMLDGHPERHVWGLGRHFLGSNFFWYLRDPAGTFSEYYSDLDCVVDDELWDPRVWEDDKALYSWGPPPPSSFINPDDLAAHLIGS
jgi:catechol 2,3-dioxygenase-like lactoylglutathione lyase family enzyme